VLDVDAIRELFPITRLRLPAGRGAARPVIYMDHAASTHPPLPVLDAHRCFLERSYANVHRGRHQLSALATQRFEGVRDDIRRFISGGGVESCVVLLGNTTQALDLAAHLMAGVAGATLVSAMEHHSNDLPHRARGEVVHFAVLADGTLDYADLERRLGERRVKLVAVTGASNVTGYLPDIRRIARLAHAAGARLLVDAAQLLAHAPVDVRGEDDPEHIDFLAAAGHKAYAPFGSAFLYAPRGLCDAAPPYVRGGGTVAWVSDSDAVYRRSPERHEGGTPNVAGAIALGASLRFLAHVGMEAIREHERTLAEQALEGLRRIRGVTVLGHPDPARRIGVLAFDLDGVPHGEVAAILDRQAAIAVRNGCFCAHGYLRRLLGVSDTPALRRLLEAGEEDAVPGAVRTSLGIYNTEAEVETLLRVVRRIRGHRRTTERHPLKRHGPAGARTAASAP
jgi:selenocysteine lyase/cysteine desulfurase